MSEVTEKLPEATEKPLRFLSWDQLQQRIPVARKVFWDWMRAGEFPLPFRVAKNKPCWLESEIEEWMLSRERGAYKKLDE